MFCHLEMCSQQLYLDKKWFSGQAKDSDKRHMTESYEMASTGL